MTVLLLAVGAGLVGAAVCAALGRLAPGLGAKVGYVGAVFPAAVFAALLSVSGEVVGGKVLAWGVPWIAELGVNFSLRLDGLGLLFALLISGIGTLIQLYAASYMAGHQGGVGAARLISTLLLFMAAMLGVVLADNVLTLFVFWEATSVASYLLIGFDHHREKARKAALQALLVTGLGGLALLVGLVLLGRAAGSMELSRIIATEGLAQSPWYPAMVILILLGCFTKSAQFPFHFWLPSAMEAPTPVSAYLHSSTMVKAGVYLLARLQPAMGEGDGGAAWRWALVGFGSATVVVAVGLALRQTGMKKLLAYTTVAALGTITLLLGLGTAKAIEAAMAFLLAHALYKAALFMVAGTLTHATGEKDAEKLGGLGRLSPALFAVAAVAAVSMAGLPPALGFIGKEVALEATVGGSGAGMMGTVALAALLVGAVGSVLVAVLVGGKPFVGARSEAAAHWHAPGVLLIACPGVLAALGVVWGVVPGLAASGLVGAAASATAGEALAVKLALWHGLTTALGLSVLAVVAGGAVYAMRRALRAGLESAGGVLDRVGPAAGYQGAVGGGLRGAELLTGWLQNDRLRWYCTVVLWVLAGAMVASLGRRLLISPGSEAMPADIVGLGLLACAGGVMAVLARRRIVSLVGLGMVGVAIVCVFAALGAPDLAMTQISADALTIVLLLVAFRTLPDFRTLSSAAAKAGDAALAAVIGGLMAAVTYLAATVQFAEPMSAYHSRASVPEGFGRNVVNVILVDFRALDTLGEITVVAMAALGVAALLGVRFKAGTGASAPEKPAAEARGTHS